MKTIKLFFIIGTLITSFSLISQEDRGKENNLITQFLSDKGATPDEKINVQCELALLEEQYKKEDKTNELISAFETVLNSFRQTGELDVSQRLYDPAHGDRKSTRLNSSHVRISYAV